MGDEFTSGWYYGAPTPGNYNWRVAEPFIDNNQNGLYDGPESSDVFSTDMNQDGKVSVRDALDILKYSLNMESSTAQWKFVPENLDTSNLSRSAVTYDNSLTVNFSEIQSEHTFLGILVGDVNGTF